MTPRRLLDLWSISDESFDVLLGSLSTPALRPLEGAREPMLGDRFVARADFDETYHAVSLAPPDVLWSWVVQTMRGGGIYGWNRLDGSHSRSSRALIDGIPPPVIGDRVDELLELCALEEGTELVWKSIVPLEFSASLISKLTLDYRVEAMQPVGARLIARMRCAMDDALRPIGMHAASTLSYILPRSQVSTIAECASSQFEQCRRPIVTSDHDSRYQHARFVAAPNGHGSGGLPL